MIRKFTTLLIIFQGIVLINLAQTIPDELTADYGPPDQANVWTKYVIPLNAETFNTDETTFQAVMANITSFWIRTEMHTGNDVGGLDEVIIGNTYTSYFDISGEEWSSGGDGTMEWVPTDGVNGGFLQISDWATGDYHWLISPLSWAGNWSELIGQNIEFWFKTDRPSYGAAVKLVTNQVPRLVLNLPNSSTVPLYDSVLVEVNVSPTPTEDVIVSLTNSANSCISIPSSIVIPAGASLATVYVSTAVGAEIGCFSVIEAKSSGYLTSRMTIKVLGTAGINEPDADRKVFIHPNPGNGEFLISNRSGKNIERIKMYDLQGKVVFESNGKDLSNTMIRVDNQSPGIFFVKMYMQDEVFTTKMIIE